MHLCTHKNYLFLLYDQSPFIMTPPHHQHPLQHSSAEYCVYFSSLTIFQVRPKLVAYDACKPNAIDCCLCLYQNRIQYWLKYQGGKKMLFFVAVSFQCKSYTSKKIWLNDLLSLHSVKQASLKCLLFISRYLILQLIINNLNQHKVTRSRVYSSVVVVEISIREPGL